MRVMPIICKTTQLRVDRQQPLPTLWEWYFGITIYEFRADAEIFFGKNYFSKK